jgi:DNA mismatch endonuclease, patch repair protein
VVDNLTSEQRSYTMSRIRSSDTKPELVVRRLTHARGLRFRIHVGDLPGRPDLVFARAKVVVFVDGDFWHGWRFPQGRTKLSPYWEGKIAGNRKRDRSNFRRLRCEGWIVVRLWEHEVETEPNECVDRIQQAVRQGRRQRRAAE